MAETKNQNIHALLSKPFAPEDLEWRVQTTSQDKTRGMAVPYVTNRAIQSRLDEVVGPENWQNTYKPWHGNGKKEAQICGISIYFEGRDWVTKWDGAEDTDVEPVKGGLSDSMKRAAVQWGIGRVLYNMEPVWVHVENKGKSCIIAPSERSKLNRAYLDMLDKLRQLPANATGTQAQLTPLATKEPAQPESAKQPVHVIEPEFPKPAEPEYDYIVEKSKIQNGMTTQSTAVSLRNKDGQYVTAFARGAHPNLTAGTKLAHVKLSLQKKDTVAFYVLESYQIVAPAKQAA